MTSCGLPNLNFPVQVKVLKLFKYDFAILSFISNENKKLSIFLYGKQTRIYPLLNILCGITK